MKNLISVVFLVLLFSSSYAQSSKTETITIETKIYCDHCMECGSCGLNINEAVLRTKGVKKVDIDPKENTITVIYKPKKISPKELRTVITEIGYDADDMKADATGYSRLDDCCKKNN